MSVCILGPSGEARDWASVAVAAASAAGSDTRLVGAMPADTVLPDTRVALASSAAPLASIMAFFAAPPAQAARRIVAVEGDGMAALPLFAVADMLIFLPAALAQVLELADIPTDVAALLPVQKLLLRHNQAAVVRFAGKGAVAVWAERTLFVAAPDGGDAVAAMASFAGVIVAAVDQGIGPERALAMAMTTRG